MRDPHPLNPSSHDLLADDLVQPEPESAATDTIASALNMAPGLTAPQPPAQPGTAEVASNGAPLPRAITGSGAPAKKSIGPQPRTEQPNRVVISVTGNDFSLFFATHDTNAPESSSPTSPLANLITTSNAHPSEYEALIPIINQLISSLTHQNFDLSTAQRIQQEMLQVAPLNSVQETPLTQLYQALETRITKMKQAFSPSHLLKKTVEEEKSSSGNLTEEAQAAKNWLNGNSFLISTVQNYDPQLPLRLPQLPVAQSFAAMGSNYAPKSESEHFASHIQYIKTGEQDPTVEVFVASKIKKNDWINDAVANSRATHKILVVPTAFSDDSEFSALGINQISKFTTIVATNGNGSAYEERQADGSLTGRSTFIFTGTNKPSLFSNSSSPSNVREPQFPAKGVGKHEVGGGSCHLKYDLSSDQRSSTVTLYNTNGDLQFSTAPQKVALEKAKQLISQMMLQLYYANRVERLIYHYTALHAVYRFFAFVIGELVGQNNYGKHYTPALQELNKTINGATTIEDIKTALNEKQSAVTHKSGRFFKTLETCKATANSMVEEEKPALPQTAA